MPLESTVDKQDVFQEGWESSNSILNLLVNLFINTSSLTWTSQQCCYVLIQELDYTSSLFLEGVYTSHIIPVNIYFKSMHIRKIALEILDLQTMADPKAGSK